MSEIIFTGHQSFYNYDSFSIASRMIGGGTGIINTAGGMWSIEDSEIDEENSDWMNFMFSTRDIVLKFHNNSPFINRFYNSTERLHIGDGVTPQVDSLPRHMGLFGRHWISNSEHCIISDDLGSSAIEVGSTGERNDWGNPGTGGFYRPC